MYLLFKRPAALLLFVALTLVLAARGIVPALSKVDIDFPNYFTAARSRRTGEYGSTIRQWVVPRSNAPLPDRKASEGNSSPFTAYGAAARSSCAIETAGCLRVVTGVSVLCLILFDHPIGKDSSWSLVDSTFSSYYPVMRPWLITSRTAVHSSFISCISATTRA